MAKAKRKLSAFARCVRAVKRAKVRRPLALAKVKPAAVCQYRKAKR